ncbi:PAS domain S-box protein [Emticicia sp. 21SJ11W-3]|uniref:PAS domain S-box protein n=1 Tax=Emticicia sp. 21SJ11W-3 TaxID=2916755 RepID=UPI00209D4D67|nr:PAS domain S-box protein [Emticicia sp. 21SJ11W-3]UTA67095.1 PAS domain S-box protein [Emticicia sp. 21SJ11W-3]
MIDKSLLEKRRVEAVHQLLEIEFDKQKDYQEIVDLVAELCEVPVSMISLLDEKSNWLKVRSGYNAEVMPRETAFCNLVVDSSQMQIVQDTTNDSRLNNNPLVYSEPFVRFYAGAPLILSNNLVVGSLCLYDLKPNSLNATQQKTLALLAKQITNLMELELSNRILNYKIAEIEERNKSLLKIAQIQSHEVRHPLTTIMGLVNLIKEGYQTVDKEWIEMIQEATSILDKKISAIVNETIPEKDLRMVRFNKMVEEIEDYAIILLDRDGKIENWNTGAAKIKGYKAIDIIGRHFSTFYTPEDRQAERPQYLLNQAIDKGFVKDEGWRVRKDGSRFWGSVVITAIHDDKHEVIGFTKVTRDLTDMKTAVADN